jgi:RNA polymerase sigma factor (sigma-70 family)
MTNDLEWWSQQASRAPLLTPAQEIALGTAVQAWVTHPAGRDDCPAPIRRRGLRARERMVTSNLRLVMKFSQRWRTRVRPCDLLDLISEGNLGLIEAVEKFDPTKGYRLSTYAWWWVKKSMDAWSNQRALMIRPPTTQAPLMHQIRVATRAHQREHGAEPVTRQQLAQATGLRVERLDEVLDRAQMGTVLSFDLHWNPDGASDGWTSMADTLTAPRPDEDPPEVDDLRAALAALDARTRQVMEALHGINQPPVTMTHLAAREGLTVHVVRQIAASGQAQLRAALSRSDAPAQPGQPEKPASHCTREPSYGQATQPALFALSIDQPGLKPKAQRPQNPARRQLHQPAHPGCCQPELFALAS